MQNEIKILQQKLDDAYQRQKLMKTLGTRQGFFQYYFEQLPQHRNQVECFNEINDLHQDLFGEWRYTDYNSFRNQVKYYHKNKK